jgi:hypothetical protein
MIDDVDVTYDQDEFNRQKDIVDWGVLVSESQGGLTVCVVALKPEEAASHLESAAAEIRKVGLV